MAHDPGFQERRFVPGFAKIIMVLQSLIIVFFSFWFVQEYLNNIYLQAYVNSVVQTNGTLIAGLVIVGSLGLVFGLLKVLRSTHAQIGALVDLQSASPTPIATSSGQVLVSKSGSASSSSSAGSSPSVELHPMVAALKADLAHQASLQPVPPLPRLYANEPPSLPQPQQQVGPGPAPVKPIGGTPSTVITGTMPVLKRVDPSKDGNRDRNQ